MPKAKKNLITNAPAKPKVKTEDDAPAPASEDAEDVASLKAQLEEAKKELANAKAKQSRSNGELTIKVSKKGAVSLYGMGRFPTTLYREQWEKVFENMERIQAFMKENRDLLPSKAERAKQ
jgi:hypothetical protein